MVVPGRDSTSRPVPPPQKPRTFAQFQVPFMSVKIHKVLSSENKMQKLPPPNFRPLGGATVRRIQWASFTISLACMYSIHRIFISHIMGF
jgi:hypothetical protein